MSSPTHAIELPPDVAWSIDVRRSSRAEPLLTVNPHQVCATASVGKVLLLVTVAEAITAGHLSSDTLLARDDAPAVADSGLWQHLQTSNLPVADLCALVGATSDNWATNALIDSVGLDTVAATAAHLGMQQTKLLDIVRDDRTHNHPPALSVGTAGELRQLFEQLHSEEGVSPAVARLVRSWLALNTDLSMVAAAFGLDPLAHVDEDRSLTLWNKTGTSEGVRCDVGIVGCGAATVSYAVLANWTPAHELDALRDDILNAMHDIGDLIRARLADS